MTDRQKLEVLKEYVAKRNENHRSDALFHGGHEARMDAMSAANESRIILAEIDRLLSEPSESATERAKRLGVDLSKIRPLSDSEMDVITGKPFAEVDE